LADDATALGALTGGHYGWADELEALADRGLVDALTERGPLGQRETPGSSVARARAVDVGRRGGGMTFQRYAVAMDGEVNDSLIDHLIRDDGQEDLCLAVYAPSSGASRFTALIRDRVLPRPGERVVRGTVEFTGDYVLRVAAMAAEQGDGVAILHSHPAGRRWQAMSTPDYDAESSYAALAQEITGLPLLGMTLAGQDHTWSARIWQTDMHPPSPAHCESVRVVGNALKFSWNDRLVPAPPATDMLSRTVDCWGPVTQADLARMRILVIGCGTVGLDVAIRLAISGVQRLGVLDFDLIEPWNLDRLIDATLWDVLLGKTKLEHADRVLRRNATTHRFELDLIDGSVCEPEVFARVLDYDLVVCAIDDRPWPRSILNTIPYSDLIPVIDGGVHVDLHRDNQTMRNATWRAHVLRPGRPCMACNGQLQLGAVQADRQNLWDDPEYVAGIPEYDRPRSQNVGLFAAGAAAGLLSQLTCFIANPSGFGEPGAVRFNLSTHWLEHLDIQSADNCLVESQYLAGDDRVLPLGRDQRAKQEFVERSRRLRRPLTRMLRCIDRGLRHIELRFQQWLLSHVVLQSP
jgi:hypothetical protein